MRSWLERAIAFWRRRSNWGKGLIVVGLVFVGFIAIGIAAGDDRESETTAADTETVTVTETSAEDTTEETTPEGQIVEPLSWTEFGATVDDWNTAHEPDTKYPAEARRAARNQASSRRGGAITSSRIG